MAALALLPIGPSERWRPGPQQDPFWLILILLTATVGLPFIALSATTPLLQDWLLAVVTKLLTVCSRSRILPLLPRSIAYPLLVEPTLARLRNRGGGPSATEFLPCCAQPAHGKAAHALEATASKQPSSNGRIRMRKACWFALAACGSMLLLSITNHIAENVAAVPLLWVVPLAVYLLTFILSFGPRRTYNRGLWFRLLAFALGILAYAIFNINAVEAIEISLPIFLLGLFVCCMFCHGELNRLRPGAYGVTGFYLTLAAGAAVGAIFVGLVAPGIFNGIYELPLTLVITAALALFLTWTDGAWPLRILWIGVAACMVVVLAANVEAYREEFVVAPPELLRLSSRGRVPACRPRADQNALSWNYRARRPISVAAFPLPPHYLLRA